LAFRVAAPESAAWLVRTFGWPCRVLAPANVRWATGVLAPNVLVPDGHSLVVNASDGWSTTLAPLFASSSSSSSLSSSSWSQSRGGAGRRGRYYWSVRVVRSKNMEAQVGVLCQRASARPNPRQSLAAQAAHVERWYLDLSTGLPSLNTMSAYAPVRNMCRSTSVGGST